MQVIGDNHAEEKEEEKEEVRLIISSEYPQTVGIAFSIEEDEKGILHINVGIHSRVNIDNENIHSLSPKRAIEIRS